MNPMLTLGLLVGCMIGACGIGCAAAPAPRKKPVLKYEMHWTGKTEAIIDGKRLTGDQPDAAEVVITNISDADVDVGSSFGPEGLLDLKVKDPAGADVETEPLTSHLAANTLIGLQPKPYILKPGEVYRCGVSLLGTVPQEKLVAGTYKVKAVCTLGKKEYASAEVDVKWPGKKK